MRTLLAITAGALLLPAAAIAQDSSMQPASPPPGMSPQATTSAPVTDATGTPNGSTTTTAPTDATTAPADPSTNAMPSSTTDPNAAAPETGKKPSHRPH